MAADPTPTGSAPDHQVIQFASRAEFEAWARREVEDSEAFIQGTYEATELWRAWRAAGNTSLPPGAILLRDYEREHPL
jgi:hypothetical protein